MSRPIIISTGHYPVVYSSMVSLPYDHPMLAQRGPVQGMQPEPPMNYVERYSCSFCGTLMEWRSVDPGPHKCRSCGAPRGLK